MKATETSYKPLSSVDSDTENDVEGSRGKQHYLERQYTSSLYIRIITGSIGLLVGLTIGILTTRFIFRSPSYTSPLFISSSCTHPTFRREWRSLDRLEKLNYIAAVQCLRSLPSKLGRVQTLYDDYPFVHSQVGKSTHAGNAGFLAWHRYFIHVFEKQIRNECNYSGHLAYWDWTLDWEDFANAPVWDEVLGFGGSNSSAPESVGGGRCVTDGPFAGLEALYYADSEEKHCLSRGFLEGDSLRELVMKEIHPHAVENILNLATYDSFNIALEEGPHKAIPRGVRGDFLKFTSPYDPVFYLHHTQLDRLWWRWQQLDSGRRRDDYGGLASDNSGRKSSLDESIDVGELGPSVTVREIMSTESELLCYRY